MNGSDEILARSAASCGNFLQVKPLAQARLLQPANELNIQNGR